VWKLQVPPRIHIFLWLLANNKLLTRDNLAKRREAEDKTCLFCSEQETVHHVFFDCCVAKLAWESISNACSVDLGSDFKSVAKWWIRHEKCASLNTFTAAVLWSIWRLRNELCSQGVA
jgi:hypothetical protein